MKFLPLIFLLLCGCASTEVGSQKPAVSLPRQSTAAAGPPASDIRPLSLSKLSVIAPPDATITPVCSSCQISWTAPVNDDPAMFATNYNIHIGFDSLAYQFVLPTDGETNGVIEGLPNAPCYFAISAIYQDGQESDLSEETQFTPPLRLQLHFGGASVPASPVLEASPDLLTWSPRAAILTNGDWLVTATNGPQEFYREVH